MRRLVRCSAQAPLGLFSVLLGLALAVTLHRSAHAPYQCEMTYMWPRYEPVDVGSEHGGRYQLLLYRDDSIAAHAAGAAPIEWQNLPGAVTRVSVF